VNRTGPLPVDLARAQLRSNRRIDAARTAQRAATAAAGLDAPYLADAAAAFLASARGGTIGSEPWSPLTAREFEVARLVADGLTNPAIAAQLDIATKTVAAHVEHILAKLSVGRRAEIAARTASVAVLHSRPHGGDREE
jgi:DNA-binding NarL/FixJ family response regulator